MRAQAPAILLLVAILALIATASSVGQDKEPSKDPKDKEKDAAKPHEFKWPTQIGGKGVLDWLKDATDHPDPAIREFALNTLPSFGTDAAKQGS